MIGKLLLTINFFSAGTFFICQNLTVGSCLCNIIKWLLTHINVASLFEFFLWSLNFVIDVRTICRSQGINI